jgi:two-component system NarL family response regulator
MGSRVADVLFPDGSAEPVPSTELPLRILIVDDDAFFRRGIREILNEAEGIQVVGEALDGEQSLQLAHELSSRGLDLVLMDTELPRLDGFAACARVVEECPGLPVVMLAATEAESELFAALRAGAVGYLTKSLAPDALVRVLHAFHRGESVPLSRTAALRVLAGFRERQATRAERAQVPPGLTKREQEVFRLIARGSHDREIAQHLVVSESTFKKHVQNILRKLHARNRAQAIALLRADS